MSLNALFLVTHLSAFTQKCSIYDTPCLASLTQNYANAIIPGGTGFGLDPLDPMTLDTIKGEQDGFIYDFSDIEILGLKNSLIERIQFNKGANIMNFKFRVPWMSIIANYTTTGYIREKLPFNGEGKLILNAHNFENELTINYEIIKGKNGKDHIKYNSYIYWFDVQYVESFFENINKDDTAKAIEVQETLKREYKKLWQQYGRPILNKFNDAVFQTLKKFLLIQPIDNILYDY